ncbi:tRNA (guanosine(46)-N7)-methyltransferase TrmB [Spiroplasma turonicum]|uniref:tRNA (guanine-N(7)-)-methyltransferase n=1 Tax=Spiroplasma turonicum TaxID=216946 RepID=A0A0K1P582_9MOLU|nr:tRNA (guanosine(46)-N7)-methyltransferase TrmB [Spiroplasma turonicum]AKU79324.1 tRNA (guanine-N(7)-)-methyltransferase [Spiroplasma turonicum]ALX70345.1 tRNA (guanine-N(7)-)-methyltransferase [Spiroplasma turonicum]
MRLRNKNWTIDFIKNNSIWMLSNKNYEECNNKFDNNNDINIEIGCGKGNFIIQKSTTNDLNFIAIEKERTVIGVALKKAISNFETPKNNLRFLNLDALSLDTFFSNESIYKIYLNFSDPWPKKRHTKYRLTFIKYLDLYYRLLKKNGSIEMKTDNENLYLFTLEEVKKTNFKVILNCDDLYSNQELLTDNIATEYETKFHSEGKKIKKIVLIKE